MGNSRGIIRKGFILLLYFITVFTLFLSVPNGSAEKKGDIKALVIYTTRDGEINEYLKFLDMLISHFTNDITFISSEKVEKKDLLNVTHLFYYGQVNVQLPSKFNTLFDDYDGTFVAIGYNLEKLGNKFSFITPLHEREINEVYLTSNKDDVLDVISQRIIEIDVAEDTEILLEGK